jgi:NADH-quinone oxidoreductase subunit C
MTPRLQRQLVAALGAAFREGTLKSLTEAFGEITVVVDADRYIDVMRSLRDRADLRFEMLIDLCGVDYSSYGGSAWEGARYGVVSHLLSLSHNRRLRVRSFAPDDDFPVSGYVEMRYDPEQARVIYQPVTIEPREVTPRVVREENYAENE